MKGIDIFCASQAATAIRLTMEEITAATSSSSATIQLGGGRAIDRFNPIITDSRRRTGPVQKPDTSNPSDKNIDTSTKKNKSKNIEKETKKRKNSRKPLLLRGEAAVGGGGGWRCTKPGGFITPQSSSRYLLNEDKDYFLDVVSDFDPITKLDDPNNDKLQLQAAEASNASSSSSPPSSRPPDQVVVVLRVSLHCRGCERKMRKHISRMQGVSSFNIDFVAKKVTVVGDVTPLGVLASISKVKNAQLWSPAVTGSSIPAPVTLTKPIVAVTPSNQNIENISKSIQLMSMH